MTEKTETNTSVPDAWHSYPKIHNLGSRFLERLLEGEVVVEEKIDGSQFSFGVFGGELKVRSRGREFHPDAADDMFKRAVESVRERQHLLTDGWAYRGEYLKTVSHNTLKYGRVPTGNIMIFDVATGLNHWLTVEQKQSEAERIGLEHVPVLFVGQVAASREWFQELIDAESVLGGPKMEGVVIKNYAQFGPDGKTLMGKHVSEDFKEVHQGTWKKENPTNKDILSHLSEKYRSEARWAKAVQHLAEAGQLSDDPKDIAALMREAQSDIVAECEGEIKDALWVHAKQVILRTSTRGLPEWYKERLLDRQFGGDNA
jgi:hypothetical protein